MNLSDFLPRAGEKPLETLVSDGGYCGILRTIGCIGDSLSSGEFVSLGEDRINHYHDYYDYSWGQFLARMAGNTVYNFSRGGMTAKHFVENFAQECGFYAPDRICQGYIIALGVNDLVYQGFAVGSAADIHPDAPEENADTFAGYMGKILSYVREISPKSRIFLVTMPQSDIESEQRAAEKQAALMHEIASLFPFTYVIDLFQYAPVYDAEFRRHFYMTGHLNACGYLLTAKMIASYIDYIIRHNMDDFCQIGFVGTPYHNVDYKW
jgi:hypothetical protein